MAELRVGIVGSGGMAKERAAGLRRLGAKVAGVWARDVTKAQILASKIGGASPFESHRALLDAVDAVVICLPNALHACFATEALEGGKHVMVEYPLCCAESEITQLQTSAERSGRVLMVGNTIIREAPYQYIHANMHRLGTLLSAASRVSFHSADMAGGWFMKPELRGPLFASMHYHHIEYYRRLLGPVASISGRDESNATTDPVAGGTVVMTHAGGGRATTSCTQWYIIGAGSGEVSRGMWLTGTRAALAIVSQSPGESHAIWNGGGQGNIDTIPDDWGVNGSNADFLQAIAGELDHRSRLASDIETLRVAWRANVSS